MQIIRRVSIGLFQLATDLVSLLFPHGCCACGVALYRGESHLCIRCISSLPYTDHHTNPDNKAAKRLWGRIPFNTAMSLLHFSKGGRVQNIIHHLKYRNNFGLGIKLGTLMAEKLQITPSLNDIDLIIPIPLHKKKEGARGYNQSQSLAEGIAAVIGVPVNNKAVIRTVATQSQTSKNRFNRYENMKDVFRVIDAYALKNRHVLLVDDVMTTGATIESCANELVKSGIKKLSIVTAALAD